MSTKKSWRDRLAGDPRRPNVKEISPATRARRGEGTITPPSPREVVEAMCSVPEGRLATVLGIGEDFAKKFGGAH
jgi:hypothetical protein